MGAVDVLGLVGRTVDQIRFDACVDSGGFGLVYRARHLGLDEDVAVKCLRIAHFTKVDEAMRASIALRFRDETKLLYRLSQGHLDIVRCIGSGETIAPATGEHTPYMILEWLNGFSLSSDLKNRRERKLPARSLADAVKVLDSAASALAYAHSQGVVHRDIKPGNLFFTATRDGMRLKLLDFGLAKILADEAIGLRPSVETAAGVHFCSPSYGAPEQFSPQVGPVGPWTDVYSLTLVLLEMMTGEKVRPAQNLADGLLKAIDPRRGSPRASALGLTVSRAVDDLLARAVAQNPLERPRDAGVFWAALRALVGQADMGATVVDENVTSAMAQVRAAQAAARSAPSVPSAPAAPAPPGAGAVAPNAFVPGGVGTAMIAPVTPPPRPEAAPHAAAHPAPRPAPHPAAVIRPPQAPGVLNPGLAATRLAPVPYSAPPPAVAAPHRPSVPTSPPLPPRLPAPLPMHTPPTGVSTTGSSTTLGRSAEGPLRPAGVPSNGSLSLIGLALLAIVLLGAGTLALLHLVRD